MTESFEELETGSQNFTEKCASLIEDLQLGKINVLNLIEDLKPLLTHPTTDQRVKAITIIHRVLNSVPDSCVQRNEFDVLANFLCERLKDHHEVLPVVIKTILVIINKGEINEGTAKRILSSLFEHIPCQMQQQPDRYNIYSIFKGLHRKKKDELVEMGLDLILGIINSIDGERDPRNLQFLFDFLTDFLKEFELGHLSEEFFEVLSCYFPVDFRPSSEDSVSRESLAKSLKRTLCSNKKFGDFVVPLALEKLDSDLSTAKLDSLELLSSISNNFEPELVLKYSTAIWAPLHKEIVSSRDETLKSKALESLGDFVKAVSSNSDLKVTSLLESMILNVKGNASPDSKFFNPSCEIIFVTASASKTSSEYILKNLIPLWVNLYNITTTINYQIDLLKVLSDLCQNSGKFGENENLIIAYNLFLKALNENNFEMKLVALNCLIKNVKFLPQNIRLILLENLRILLTSSDVDFALECLGKYAKYFPEEARNLITKLKSESKSNSYLKCIGKVLENPELETFCIEELIQTLHENSKENSRMSLKILRDLKENDRFENNVINTLDFALILTKWFLENSKEIINTKDICEDISIILYRTVSKLYGVDQETMVRTISHKIPNSQTIEESFPIWFGILVALDGITQTIFIEFYEKCVKAALITDNRYINLTLSQLIGNFVNKIYEEDVLRHFLNIIETQINLYVENHEKITNVINLISFVTKGLVLNGNETSSNWINKLLQLVENHVEASNGIRIILDENYPCFTKICRINQRLLYKQKFFTDVMTYITNNGTLETGNYLTIVAYLVIGIPESLFHMNITNLTKWIILYLDKSEDNQMIRNICEILNKTIEKKIPDLFRYTAEIIKIYLKLSKENPSMKVRIETLKGIRLFADLPVYEILTYKTNVVNNLNKCVDDKKRLVRKEAMETRLKWYLIDSPI